MKIEYLQLTPDIQTYYDLGESVGWNNFCAEQTEFW